MKYFPRYHPSCSLRSLSRTLKGTNLAAFTASSGNGKISPAYRFTPATGSLKRFKIVVSVIASYLSSAIIASCIPKSKRILMHWLKWILVMFTVPVNMTEYAIPNRLRRWAYSLACFTISCTPNQQSDLMLSEL